MRKFALILALMASIAMAAYPKGSVQRRLTKNMTEAQVVKLLGEPDAVQLLTKSDDPSLQADRRVFKYTTDGQTMSMNFHLHFLDDDKTKVWVLDSWQ